MVPRASLNVVAKKNLLCPPETEFRKYSQIYILMSFEMEIK